MRHVPLIVIMVLSGMFWEGTLGLSKVKEYKELNKADNESTSIPTL